jgi:hypothetical protein
VDSFSFSGVRPTTAESDCPCDPELLGDDWAVTAFQGPQKTKPRAIENMNFLKLDRSITVSLFHSVLCGKKMISCRAETGDFSFEVTGLKLGFLKKGLLIFRLNTQVP